VLQAAAAEETMMMREKDLDGSQMKAGREDGMRDRPPSQKKMPMTPKTMNSLTCSHGSWPTPWTTNESPSGTPCHV